MASLSAQRNLHGAPSAGGMLPLHPARSLSAKLLVLTVLFVMLAEVLIFTPSVARFRLSYLEERLAAAHLAALAVDAAPDGMVTRDLKDRLLAHVGAHVIDLDRPGTRVAMLARSMPPQVDATVDLRDAGFAPLIADALSALARHRDRVIRVLGASPKDPAARVEVVMDERPMIAAMRDFAVRILALSVVISLITAGLVFVSLHRLFVRPMRRLTADMVAFRQDPRAISPLTPAPTGDNAADDGRADEIGVAQRELAAMRHDLSTALRQRERLAALGTAVTKINHDLRGILATASLLSEHLGSSADPEVRRVTPRLMAALDRAVDLCGQTLSYSRDGVLPLKRRPVDLAALAAQVGEEVKAGLRSDADWVVSVPHGLRITADPDQLARALVNLGRNAVQAGADRVTVAAQPGDGRVTLTVSDTGPGLPPRARDALFQPFAGSARAGGIGLGLAIAREIARAHGGDLWLVDSTAAGTTFALDLPA